MPSPANANRLPSSSAPWTGLTDLFSSSSSLLLARQRTRHPSDSTDAGTLPSSPGTPPISPSDHHRTISRSSDSPVPPSPLRRSISLRLRPLQFQSPPPPQKKAATSATGTKRRILRWRSNPSVLDPSATDEEDVMAYVQHGGTTLGPAAQIGGSTGGGAPQTPQAVYQHILDTTAKRISTLDYLRKSCVPSFSRPFEHELI
jgi:hypothetical protein